MPVVNIKGLQVSYEEAGEGIPVVFIPGLTGAKEWFRYQFSGLSQSYRIISYDPRSADRHGPYSIQLLANDLADFLRAIRAHSAVICGHSFGGLIAQEFALSYPQGAAALVLISAFASLPQEPPSRLLSWLTPRAGLSTGPAGWLKRLLPPFGRQDGPDSIESLQHSAIANGPTVEARLRLALSVDLTGRLPEIPAPTLVIVGGRDREQIIHSAQVLYENTPDSSLEVIEGGDHFCFYSRHDLVNAAIDDFLTGRLASLI